MSKWISVKDKLPKHHQKVLTYAPAGQAVFIFVDSIKMNKILEKTGYGHEAVNINDNPYYFVSQEMKQHTSRNVTHWMPIPEPPKEFLP